MSLMHPARYPMMSWSSTIASLSAVERAATATLIAYLTELEARNLHLAQGFRSLFGYCRHVLHCSEAEAYNRMEAVHAARRFPVILALLAEGRLHLTAVRLLAPHLRDEDHLALLGGAIHKSRREIVALLARWFPSPDVLVIDSEASSQPAKASLAEAAPQIEAAALSAAEAPLLVEAASTSAAEPPGPEAASPGGSSAMAKATRSAPRPGVVPLSADRYRLQVTSSETRTTI